MSSADILVGRSAGIAALRAQIERLVARPVPGGRLPPVLVLGETGTGKGLLVRIMHQQSARRDMPLVEINCAAIPENLVEAELFGFERGAFTDARQAKPGLFQAAHRGVLFLDEIGTLPLPVQAKLLTALERREVRRLGSTRTEPVDTWIVSATNENLQERVDRREFRLDLYHRISTVTLRMPALRERGRDVLVLARHFLERISADYALAPRRLTHEAEEALLAHAWPGNVRELINLLERAVLLADSDEIGPEGLELAPPPSRRREAAGPAVAPGADSDPETLLSVLEATGWNLSRAAARLGVPRNTLRYRIERLGLRPGPAEPSSPPADAALPAGAPPAPRLRWEKRWVTGLLVRLEPPPAVSGFHVTPLLDELVEKVERFGGRVEELHPLGFTALFGQEPSEDAPWRAGFAAQAVQKAVESARDLEGGRPILTVALHIAESLIALGAPTGGMDLEDRRRLRDVLSTLAAAPGRGVVTSAAAAGFLERRFALERLPGDPHGSAQLIGPRHSGFDVGGRARSPFVGRDREIGQLDDMLAEAERGHGQIVGLVGEAGVGKSRLLYEFNQAIGRERVTLLEGRCAAHGSHSPYLPIIQLVRQTAGLGDEGGDPDAVASAVRQGVAALGLPVADVAPYLLHLLGAAGDPAELSRLTPQAVRQRTLEALRQVVVAASQQRTLVLAVEDLHWIDATSSEVLLALADSVAACRILMLLTYRQGYQPSWLGKSYATQLVLRPLGPRDSLAIVSAVAPAGAVPAEVADALVARADGIPFYLEELVRAVADRPADAALADIPGTIQGVVTARLDRLPVADRDLLGTAAVLGREGPVSLLREVSGLAEPDFAPALHRLRALEFLRETRVVPSAAYAFTHVLTQEVAYASLSPDRRRVLHGSAAAAIEKVSPLTAERMPELIAAHLTEAGLVAAAIGQWHRAGRLAIQRSANAEAAVHLRKALLLLEKQPDDAARAGLEMALLLSLVAALTASRGYAATEVEGGLSRVRALVDEQRESPQTFVVRWNLWRFYASRANFRAAEELAMVLLGAAERQGDVLANLNASVAAGINKFYLGEFAAARRHLERAIELHGRGKNPQQIATYGQDMGTAARGFLGWTLAVTGDLDAAARDAARALEMARELGHPFSLALVLLTAAEVHQLRRDAEAVATLGRELLDLAREHAFTFFSAFGLMFTGWARAASGDHPGGLALMQEGASLFQHVGQRLGLAHRAHLAEVMIAGGRFDDGRAVVEEALRQSVETGEGAFVAELHRLRGEAFHGGERLEEARACLRDALGVATAEGAWLFALRAASTLVRLDAARGVVAAADLDALRAIVNRFPPAVESSDLDLARTALKGERR